MENHNHATIGKCSICESDKKANWPDIIERIEKLESAGVLSRLQGDALHLIISFIYMDNSTSQAMAVLLDSVGQKHKADENFAKEILGRPFTPETNE